MGKSKTPPEIKQHLSDLNQAIALRVCVNRVMKGYTQTTTAKMIGLSLQQMQKYEAGGNRISAPTLFYLAQVLDVPIAEFFPDQDTANYTEFPFTKRDWVFLRDFKQLTPGVQLAMHSMIQALLKEAN